MILYALGDITIDPRTREFRKGDDALRAEARVFDLAYLLVSNSERLVTKQEIVDVVWDGRAISDNAISTAIKDLRKILGDDGNRQSMIKTIHGQGFRCIAPVENISPAATNLQPALPSGAPLREAEAPSLRGKPSIAVLPFQDLSPVPDGSPIAYAIPTELISAFSRLRWIAVTARGSSFRFNGPDTSHQTIRNLLNVEYMLTGAVEIFDRRLNLTIELAETQEGRVIWGDRFTGSLDDIHEIRSQISAAVVSALEIHIPAHEAGLARAMPAEHLDAWAQYHLGVQHMYRFNQTDNQIAAGHFRRAIEKQPDFARAHAGLSFTAFQNAFLNYHPDRDEQVKAAVAHAERSMELDAYDPFANYNMGRSCWITGEIEASTTWLDRSTQVSPNFAQGHYVTGLMKVLSGQTAEARVGAGLALQLSPLDPLGYAMMSCHSMSYVNEGLFDDAVHWAERGALAPGAHYLVMCTAAIANTLNGNPERAQKWITEAQSKSANRLTQRVYFNAFPFTDNASRARISGALSRLGIK
jgi:TolB-like protein/Flp pilus assembly protein TadD